MTSVPSSSGSAFRLLCRVLGGQDKAALDECMTAALLPQIFDVAHSEDLLPALAVRCDEQKVDLLAFGATRAQLLRQALLDNTRGNMEMIAQALKFTRELNRAGITPLFLKGTARLLSAEPQNLGFRKQVDIDLIVQPHELQDACESFLAHGYRFYGLPDGETAAAIERGEAVAALKLSAAHHHLPPLVKANYAASVELHRHFLPRRFAHSTPLEPLFGSARRAERQGSVFLLPSTEYQLVHLLLGKWVHDGHLARHTFPIREACDLIEIMEQAGNNVDLHRVAQRCGRSGLLFHALVCELMRYTPRSGMADLANTSRYTRIMQKRFESPVVRGTLDIYARVEHLAYSLAYSPAKLPAYLRRMVLWSKT